MRWFAPPTAVAHGYTRWTGPNMAGIVAQTRETTCALLKPCDGRLLGEFKSLFSAKPAQNGPKWLFFVGLSE